MMQADEQIRDQALTWALRTGDPAFADWEGFTAWLEADPAHAVAYDAVAGAIADAAQVLAAAPANDDAPLLPVTRRRWLGGAIAAALAVVALVGVWNRPGGAELYETAPGETQLIALADGSTIELAGGTVLELPEGTATREAVLREGQALFTIVHNDADPFVLMAGADRLVDAGTVFDVKLGSGGLTLGVSEGAVIYNPAAANLRVDAGNGLVARPGSAPVVAALDPQLVGEWREGRLTFDMAPLPEVAEDLTRATGIAFTARDGGRGQRISGSILLAPVIANPRSLEGLLGVRVSPRGQGWEIAGQ
ncbi:FecR family protein [Alteraurantiacibacter palmitatis]|uniref:FecR family protein n=1 Tax=Alteraurantiacibacter palmitatis TaxID=2054628 RepID=A0ABV7E8D5_9SPHN